VFCPQCGQEYRGGVVACNECGSVLVQTPPAAERDEAVWVDLVTVLETGDLATTKVVKSLLEAEGIPCLLRGEGLQDLLGFGRAGTGFNVAMGPVQVQVRRGDAAVALELIEAQAPLPGDPGDLPEEGAGV
jgi:hypothetical protein